MLIFTTEGPMRLAIDAKVFESCWGVEFCTAIGLASLKSLVFALMPLETTVPINMPTINVSKTTTEDAILRVRNFSINLL